MRISDWSSDVCSSDLAINGTLLLVLVATGAYIVYMHGAVPAGVIAGFFALALVYGVMMTMPIGGAAMPVVITLYNVFTGLAVGLAGDRKSVVEGQGVSVRVDHEGSRILKKTIGMK